jgi:hypothetical protein
MIADFRNKIGPNETPVVRTVSQRTG